MGKTVKINELDKKLYKTIRKAIDKKAAKEIVPLVKKVYKNHAKKDLAKMKAKSTSVGVDNDAISSMGNKIGSKMAANVTNTIPKNGEFIVFNKLEPDNPLWGNITSPAPLGDVFAEWIVDGDLVIHPALTQYCGKNIEDWKKYVEDYRVEAVPFIDNTIERIYQKKNWSRITNIVRNAIVKELSKH